MTILVTGGAGYIGSHAVEALIDRKHNVIAVDNLDRGHSAAVPPEATFYGVDLADTQQLARIMAEHRVTGVMHFAALAYVGESVEQPLRYYANNTAGSISLLRAMQSAGVKRLVFSSTCATYGIPDKLPIIEETLQQPINPYGRSKLFVEEILKDHAASDPEFGFIAPRYFNVAGCSAKGRIGEDHTPETHLIPILLQVALGQRECVQIFGDDYPTEDGTCIRDYIHVDDLCAAHLTAMDAIQPGDCRFYNLGIGRGYSVKEIVDAARKVTGHEIPAKIGPRRPGDPPVLFANANKIRRELNWEPKVPEIDQIIQTAWRWFRQHPRGYSDK